MKLVILPIGNVETRALHFIQDGLKRVFASSEIVVLETVMSIPDEAYEPLRRQYHSTYMLAKMDDYVRKMKPQPEHVLGVTEVDLYVQSLNFVFGEAQCPGRFALVSLFRLRPEFYGEVADGNLFLERALKEASHELGHTLGLGHCKNSLCVMFFSNSIADTDKKRAEFCEKCRRSVT